MDPDVVTTQRLEMTRLADGKKMINHYVLDGRIGKGQHGQVWKCHDHLNTNKIFAVKAVKRDNPKARRERQYKQLRQQNLPPRRDHVPVVDGIRTTEQEIRKEIAIMKKCRHPHVVRLYEVIDDRKNDTIYMVMEYLGGGEIHYTNGHNQPILTVEQTRRIMRDAILGLEYLHHQGIIHRDIKPANLIWTSGHDRVKIADFGTAHFSYAQRLLGAQLDGLEASSSEEDPILLNDADLAKRAGSPAFLAPEIVWEYTEGNRQPRPPVTKAIDIWALGVTLYCFLFGKTPFRPPGTYSLSEWTGYQCTCNQDWRAPSTMGYDKVRTGGRHPPEEEVERGELGPVVIHLLDHFLKKDVVERITLEEVKANRWFLLDLPNPSTWLEITSPNPIQVSPQETSDAMSTLRFRWARFGRSRGGPTVASTSTSASGTNTATTTGQTTPNKSAATTRLETTITPTPNPKSPATGMGLARRIAAFLGVSPSTPTTPTATSPSSLQSPASSSHQSSVTNILGIRMHRSQNALVTQRKGERPKKVKVKRVKANNRGGIVSEPTEPHGLRRIKSDRDADAERERRERQRERERRKKRAKEAASSPSQQSTLTPGAQSKGKGKGKGKERQGPEENVTGRETPKPSTAPVSIPNAASTHAPSPSRARSGSMRSLVPGEQRAPSPSGKRLTGLISTITNWRPSSRGSHSGSPVEERTKGKEKEKEKRRDPKLSSSISSKRSGTSESDIEFANPYRSTEDLTTSKVPQEQIYRTNSQGHQAPSSRSSSSAALFALRSGSSGSRSGSASPPVISPTFATAVMSGGVADVIPTITGISSSIGSSTSSSSLGGLANRRISSWDQGANADPDSRSLTSSYQSDDFDDEYDEGSLGINAVDYYNYGLPTVNGSSSRPGGGGIVFMKDEVDANYSGSESDDSVERDDQGTYEGTLESTVEGRTGGSHHRDSDHRGTPTEDDGLTFSTKKRREGT